MDYRKNLNRYFLRKSSKAGIFKNKGFATIFFKPSEIFKTIKKEGPLILLIKERRN